MCLRFEGGVRTNPNTVTIYSHAAAGSWSGPIRSRNYTSNGIAITYPFYETWSGSFDFIWGAETPVGD
jgi:hypothetical protein